MTGEAWNVGFSTSRYPQSQQTRSPQETALLHELIVQAVTERKIDVDPSKPYDVQLESVFSKIRSSEPYKSLLSKPSLSRSEVSALLDQQHLQRLPQVESSRHVTLMMVTGGPATGKSGILNTLSKTYPDIYTDAAKINPDDYKPLLASKAVYSTNYADVAHEESSHLTTKIMARLEEKMAAGRAPHVVMDVVAANERRMQFAQQTGNFIVVTGTAPPEVTVERALERSRKPGGRSVPTEIVLDGARKVAATTPNIFAHPNVQFKIVSTYNPQGTANETVAQWDKKTSTLVVYKPELFVDFVERQNVNIHARKPEEVLRAEDKTPQRIAEGMKSYTDKGVTLAFLNANGEVAMTMSRDGVDTHKPLVLPDRGVAFVAEMATAMKGLLVRQNMTEQKRPSHQEHAHTETKAPIKTGAIYGSSIPAGMSAGMGLHGVYDAMQPNSSVRRDVDAGGAQALFGGMRFSAQALDAGIGTLAAVEGTHRAFSRGSATVVGIAQVLPEQGIVSKIASKTAIPAALTIGTLDVAAGVMEKDPERVAGATARTGLGIWGAVKGGAAAGATWGAISGSPTGPEAIAAAGVGALGGALVMGTIGEEGARTVVRKVTEFFGDDKKSTQQPTSQLQQNHPLSAPRPATAMSAPGQSKDISPDMLRALNAAMGSNLSTAIRCDSPQAAQMTHVPHAAPRQQTQGAAACR